MFISKCNLAALEYEIERLNKELEYTVNRLQKYKVFSDPTYMSPTNISLEELRRDVDGIMRHLGLAWITTPEKKELVDISADKQAIWKGTGLS